MKTSEALARLRGGKTEKKHSSTAALIVLINAEHQAVQESFGAGLVHALRCGELLLRAKGKLNHGEWIPWVERHCSFSLTTATRYILVVKNHPDLCQIKHGVPNLSFRQALKMLATPDESPLMSSATTEWYTPGDFVRRVDRALGGIELDPCSDSVRSVTAEKHFTKDDDGLARDWFGRVYMNPPYGGEISAWVEKLCKQYALGNVTEAIALVPARVDTEWFRMFRDFTVCFVSGRLKFSGHDNSAPFPSAVVYLGKNPAAFCAQFEEIGDIWARVRTKTSTSA